VAAVNRQTLYESVRPAAGQQRLEVTGPVFLAAWQQIIAAVQLGSCSLGSQGAMAWPVPRVHGYVFEAAWQRALYRYSAQQGQCILAPAHQQPGPHGPNHSHHCCYRPPMGAAGATGRDLQ
jgi:hypothetical protein